MKIGKPYMKVLKAAFNMSTKEVRELLIMCESDPKMALSFAGECGKYTLIEPLVKS